MTFLYFAWVRERIGYGREVHALPDGIETLGALLDWLALRSTGHEDALKDRAKLRFAINQTYAFAESPVGDKDEIAIFPPVTGG